MRLNIVICDDNPVHLSYLKQTVEEYDKTGALEILTFSDAAQLDRELDHLNVDIAFMDISMGESNGIHVGRKIKEMNPTAAIIFVTGYASFAVAAFELRASHYLIKPVMAYKIHAILDEILAVLPGQKAALQKKRCFTIETKKRYIRLEYDNIMYFEKDQRKVIVHTQVNQYDFYGTFKELRKFLDMSDTFIQCHQGFIVNVHRIQELGPDGLKLQGDIWVPVSRRFRSAVEEGFERVMFSEVGLT